MSFRELVERVVKEVPGCVNCTILGFDGIAIDSAESLEPIEGISSSDATIEYANLVTQIRAAALGLQSGTVEDVCIKSEKMTTILRPLTEEYLVAATLAPNALIGKARYLLRLVDPLLRTELE